MKATVEFDLPAEWDELRHLLSGPDAIGALSAIDSHLRNVIKHGPGGHVGDALQSVRDLLYQYCNANGVPLD